MMCWKGPSRPFKCVGREFTSRLHFSASAAIIPNLLYKTNSNKNNTHIHFIKAAHFQMFIYLVHAFILDNSECISMNISLSTYLQLDFYGKFQFDHRSFHYKLVQTGISEMLIPVVMVSTRILLFRLLF